MMERQFLIIDADDTLWENNIYFERAFDDFVAFLDHSSLTPREIRDILDEIERENAKSTAMDRRISVAICARSTSTWPSARSANRTSPRSPSSRCAFSNNPSS